MGERWDAQRLFNKGPVAGGTFEEPRERSADTTSAQNSNTRESGPWNVQRIARTLEALYDEFRSWLSKYDPRTVALNFAALAFCFFSVDQVFAVVRTGHHSVRNTVLNLSKALTAAGGITLLFFLSQFHKPGVYFFSSWSAPSPVLTVIVSVAAIMLFLPPRFWQQLKERASLLRENLNAQASESSPVRDNPTPAPSQGFRQVAQMRAGSHSREGCSMQLKLRRSQRSGGMLGSKVIFALDARTDLSLDEKGLVSKYGLGKLVVYDSEARKKHGAAAYGHFENAATIPGYSMSSAGRGVWSNARALASAAMAALSLRVTVDSLMGGHHIECKDLDQLLGAEAAIVDACKNLRAYLDTAQTFDGREEVVEF
jgi:hypothetical protein